MTFGENLTMIRTSHGLSQVDLAKSMGVSQSAISAWERGTREPNFEACEHLADIFNIPLSSLMIPSEPQAGDDYVRYVANYLHNDPKKRILFDMSTKATPEEMDAVITVFKAILKERDGE